MITGFDLDALRERVFYYTLLLFVIFLPFSEAMVSILPGVLFFQMVLLTSWKHPSVPRGFPLSLLLVTAVFLVYLAGMITSRDFSFALYELRKVIFWIVIPVPLFFSPRLSDHRFYTLLLLFVVAVVAASFEATGRFLLRSDIGISHFREIIHISHIRFSFQVILALITLVWFMVPGAPLPLQGLKRWWLIFPFIWLLLFLLVLKSLTGVIALLGSGWVFLLILVFRQQKLWKMGLLAAIMILLLVAPAGYVVWVWHDFHDSEELNPATVDRFTSSGNPYTFDFGSRERENGHWVNSYICEEELRREWKKISSIGYDHPDASGYICSYTLIRYMTSLGLRKDSAGISKLTNEDIRAIEQGIANHNYVRRSFSLYPRVYEVIWELDHYSRKGDPNNQSFSQRIEFVKASLILISQNRWFGIGTGNWKQAYSEAYLQMDSRLSPDNQGPSHNQYLNYLVKFGITGFVCITLFLLIPLFREKHRKNLFFWMFLVSIGFANLGDANLETHMGLSFFSFFYSLLLWHSPPALKGTAAGKSVSAPGDSF